MNKLLTLIIGLVIFFNGCAEEQKIMYNEISLDEYETLYNLKKDKTTTLFNISKLEDIYSPENINFGSKITNQQHIIIIKDIESYLSDNKITYLEYSNIINKLKTFYDENKELEREQAKKEFINELKSHKNLDKK